MSDIHIEDAGGELVRRAAPASGAAVELPEPKLVLLTGAYCPQGCPLIHEESPKFDGFPGIQVRARWQEVEGILTLSPFQGDKRKTGPAFPEGALLDLSCPSCGTPLPVLGPCACEGEFVALYTVRNPDPGFVVGICRRWGCFRSFLKEAGQVITEYRILEPGRPTDHGNPLESDPGSRM